MEIVKKICKKIFGMLGYELHRTPQNRVNFENFKNITRAYERYLNDSEDIIAQNEIRPKLLARLEGTPPTEAYFIVQSLARTSNINGCVCEFGVAQGETSALIANEISSGAKVLHLFDSFQGLPVPSEKDRLKDDIFLLGNIKNYAGTMACPEEMAKSRLKAVSFPPDRFIVHKGFIEEVLRDAINLPKEVSFAYVDFDFYQPIKTTLDFLHRVTVPEAIIIVDDYDFFSTGAKTAVDEFLAENNPGGINYECMIPDKDRYGCFAVLKKKVPGR